MHNIEIAETLERKRRCKHSARAGPERKLTSQLQMARQARKRGSKDGKKRTRISANETRNTKHETQNMEEDGTK